MLGVVVGGEDDDGNKVSKEDSKVKYQASGEEVISKENLKILEQQLERHTRESAEKLKERVFKNFSIKDFSEIKNNDFLKTLGFIVKSEGKGKPKDNKLNQKE